MISFQEKQLFAFRPKPFFFITTNDAKELTAEKVQTSLQKLKRDGFGGFVLFNKPSTGFDKTGYLSEDWFLMVEHFAAAAKSLGLEMWINDGFDFPPGSVGGRVREIDGSLSQQYLTKSNGKVTIVNAEWGYPAFELPRSEELFAQLVYEQYEKHVGKYFGDPIVGFFSDADNRRVLSDVMFDPREEGCRYFPWSLNFAQTFREKYGYDIEPYLPAILDRQDIDQTVDYWAHAGELYQSWFAGNYRWLQAHGLSYTGHSGDTSPMPALECPRSSALTEGRFLDVQNNSDYPGTDQELYAIDGGKHMRAQVFYSPKALFGSPEITEKMTAVDDISEDTRAKQVGSSVYLNKKKGGMCEMFAASNFGVEPQMLRRIAAFQIMQGITFVVPHAYHYRFRGDTKYFAPPDFSPNGMLKYSIRELNDFIARSCALMNAGETVAPVALLDPTEAVWRNTLDSRAYLRAFNKLNHQASGYVICDVNRILNGKAHFKAAVLAGFTLRQEEEEGLKKLGVKLLSQDDLDMIPAITGCDVCYRGEGTPIFAQRRINGEEITIISSVETNRPITGIISGYGRSKAITLYPGEIRWFSACEDDIPLPQNEGIEVAKLPVRADAVFEKENLLPLEVFSNGKETVTKMSGEKLLYSSFKVTGALTDLKLFIPEEIIGAKTAFCLDGTELTGQKTMVFDDEYMVYLIPVLEKGTHVLEMKETAKIEQHDRIFLQGTFDVNVRSNGYPFEKILGCYNIAVYIPYAVEITLSPRRTKLLTDDSWARQGQPFYSGTAVYKMQVELPEKGKYRLTLPRVRDVAWCSIDGKAVGKCIASPYTFEFEAAAGLHELEVKTANSFANAMEYYLEESGILSGGIIELLQ